MKKGLHIFFIFTVLILSACGDRNDSDQINISENKTKWNASSILSYQYTYQKHCFCEPGTTEEVSITVVADIITSITQTRDRQEVDPALFDAFKTVDKLFSFVEEAINEGADTITVTYDEVLGYPTRIEIDYISGAIDDEITIITSNLVAN